MPRKRVAQLLGEEIEGPATGIGHRHEPATFGKPCQRLGAVGKTFPVLRGVPETFSIFRFGWQAKLWRDFKIDPYEVVWEEVGVLGIARCAVKAERFLAIDRDTCLGGNAGETVLEATFEVDQGADDVESHVFELLKALAHVDTPVFRALPREHGFVKKVILFPAAGDFPALGKRARICSDPVLFLDSSLALVLHGSGRKDILKRHKIPNMTFSRYIAPRHASGLQSPANVRVLQGLIQ